MVVCYPESESRKKIALDTEQDLTPRLSVSCGGSSASGARPSITTSTDQIIGASDATREARTGPTQDVTRTSSEDHIGGDVAMRGDGADESSGGHPSSSGSDSRGRITTKRIHVKSEMSNRAPLNSTFREGSWGRRRPQSTKLR